MTRAKAVDTCRASPAGAAAGVDRALRIDTERPVESKTRTRNGRVGSAWRSADGGAGRRWAEQGADISVTLEANRPLALQRNVKTVLNVYSQTRTKEILCKPLREQNVRLTRGLSPVYHRDCERSSLMAVDQCTDAYLSL